MNAHDLVGRSWGIARSMLQISRSVLLSLGDGLNVVSTIGLSGHNAKPELSCEDDVQPRSTDEYQCGSSSSILDNATSGTRTEDLPVKGSGRPSSLLSPWVNEEGAVLNGC